jgi:UDP-2-acetamido-3-amino-2,3-dideoxy-glucuronate N-acetyltransferase
METVEKFIGLIGLGYWGKNILRNLYDLGAIRSACDNNPETIIERRLKFPGLKYTASFSEMLGDNEIKAVAIATWATRDLPPK